MSSGHSTPAPIRRRIENRRVVSILVAACLIALSADAQSVDLVIHAWGFKNDTGTAVAKLFIPGDNVRRHGHVEVASIIHNEKAEIVFPSLPEGDYAVVVFHDSNNNDEIDHNWIGLPAEGLGFSNGFRLSLTSGLPTFEKLRFAHGGQSQTLMIEVKE